MRLAAVLRSSQTGAGPQHQRDDKSTEKRARHDRSGQYTTALRRVLKDAWSAPVGSLATTGCCYWHELLDPLRLLHLARIRPRRGAISAQRDRAGADRRRAQDVRARANVHAHAAGNIPPRERLRSAVAARLQPAGILHLLEISRHRSRSAQIDQGATLAGRCRNPRKRARPSRTGSAVRA